MPSALPAGDPAPADGRLPPSALENAAGRELGVYVHVPFCATRCGYCDFNTYTAGELGDSSPTSYVDAAIAELRTAARTLAAAPRAASTVFFGGGTPTLLPPRELARLLDAVREHIGLAADAEVTTEANPESVSRSTFDELRAAGFTRISLGMQSAVPHVLATLDRAHAPNRAVDAAREAVAAGFDHVSLDLIYGTPGESDGDWRASLETALTAPIDHLSAYALVVEDGTALARKVARGDVMAVDDDVLAARYEQAEALLSAAGLHWYEVSNWARDVTAESRHNRLYWQDADWWGIGPGAHSHVGGVRWWNVKHPAAYVARLSEGASPAAARELLDDDARRLEAVLLGIRVREGLPLDGLDPDAVAELAREGLVAGDFRATGRVVLTLRGRLLADAVTRALT
ncbi:MAG TPA: radical SAM family heme chaperone HemW [Mycobacteriales bacterium]|nr:radical SAM family heme chaperone HemW [Mycobacteriales bacterium]